LKVKIDGKISREGADKNCIHGFVGVTSQEKFNGKIKENVE
jgi:hypothetical protein